MSLSTSYYNNYYCCPLAFASSAVYDYVSINTIRHLTIGFLIYHEELDLRAYEDGEAEESEGFVLYLDLVESELDPRDVGLVNISRNAYLIRINESGILHFVSSSYILPPGSAFIST